MFWQNRMINNIVTIKSEYKYYHCNGFCMFMFDIYVSGGGLACLSNVNNQCGPKPKSLNTHILEDKSWG